MSQSAGGGVSWFHFPLIDGNRKAGKRDEKLRRNADTGRLQSQLFTHLAHPEGPFQRVHHHHQYIKRVSGISLRNELIDVNAETGKGRMKRPTVVTDCGNDRIDSPMRGG